jgi:hypothetical protein
VIRRLGLPAQSHLFTKEHTTMTFRRRGLLGATLLALLLLVAGTASAEAAGPAWKLDALPGATSVTPGASVTFHLDLANVGEGDADGSLEPIVVSGELPAGMTLVKVSSESTSLSCAAVPPSGKAFSCEIPESVPGLSDRLFSHRPVSALVEVDPAASGPKTARFEVHGGDPADGDPNLPAAAAAATLSVTESPPAFGIHAFDQRLLDQTGAVFSQAGGHPFLQTTDLDFNSYVHPAPLKGDLWPVEATKDVFVALPPGFVGTPTAAARCSLAQLSATELVTPKPECPPESQVGGIYIKLNAFGGRSVAGPVPIFELEPPPDAPARFGFNVAGVITVFDVDPDSSTNYGLLAKFRNLSEGLAVVGSQLDLWGVPTDPVHDSDRACPGEKVPTENGPTCSVAPGTPQLPFLRNSTECAAAGGADPGQPITANIDSWADPGDFDQRTIHTHQAPGYSMPESEWGAPQGPQGCDEVDFEPQIEATPTTNTADSPSGLDFHLKVPQGCWQDAKAICQADLKNAEVTLPAGMSLNPASAAGLGSCSPAQIGLTTPVGQAEGIRFDESVAGCPESSKLGIAEITTPLLEAPLEGSIYQAQQSQNPFGSLFGIYFVAEGSGVQIKQAGELVAGANGRLTTIFRGSPQQPFSDLRLLFFGGPRAPLRTPAACGTYGVAAKLTPWSGNAAVSTNASFKIANCPSAGFAPRLAAGTQNPLAGKTSPFSLRIARDDGTQELGGLQLTLPPGLSGYLKGIPSCSEAALASLAREADGEPTPGTGRPQEASPSCPPASQLGTVTVGAGVGPNPFYSSSGRAYLAGPYKGAPLSLAVIAPAVAGPFDLGSVLVRNALYLNPESAQITAVSDPLPRIIHGIPLDLRDVRVALNRDRFTLNPTSCEQMRVSSALTSTQGATASPSQRFQVAGCDRLGFKPRLSLKLKGGTRRGENPALTAVMRPRIGDANASRVQVALPHSEFLDQSHIGTICTRVQFAAEACPARSVYGTVTATTPILDQPLSGKVYLRSSSHQLPDLVLALRGPASQPIEVDAVGRIDSIKGGIRTTFATVPDAPLTKVVLRMGAGKKSLLQNSTNICRATNRATVKMVAHNGAVAEFAPALEARSCKGKGRRGSGR